MGTRGIWRREEKNRENEIGEKNRKIEVFVRAAADGDWAVPASTVLLHPETSNALQPFCNHCNPIMKLPLLGRSSERWGCWELLKIVKEVKGFDWWLLTFFLAQSLGLVESPFLAWCLCIISKLPPCVNYKRVSRGDLLRSIPFVTVWHWKIVLLAPSGALVVIMG